MSEQQTKSGKLVCAVKSCRQYEIVALARTPLEENLIIQTSGWTPIVDLSTGQKVARLLCPKHELRD